MNPDLTIVLLGGSGVGTVFGNKISVVDTPGILESEEEIRTWCQKFLQTCRPHLFLVVLRVDRFTEEEERAFEAAVRVLGDQGLKNSFLLFTGGDSLRTSLKEYFSQFKRSPLIDWVNRFGGRFHLFNNKAKDQQQVRQLLEKSEELRDTNTPVSSSACGVSLSDSSMAKQCNASSKYQDIISNSTLISKPLTSPAVYQLRPKEEKFGTLTRKTVGEKNLNKTNRTILLVGETGTGKSTLINTLVNYTMGVKFEDNIWFEIVEEEEKNIDQCESQTSDVIVYEIFGYEDETPPYSLTIIDTPGFGDTRGIKCDAIVSQRLFDLFRSDDGVHELSAVGLVLKASENRVSDRLRYIFDSVMSLFGKDIEENIIALITHSDGLPPKNALKALEAANIKCAKDEENETVHFLFDNRQNEQRTESGKLALKSAWKLTEARMKCFTDFLKESKPQKLNETVEVLNSRIRLTACIQNLQERIELTELKQREIQLTEEDLKKHEEEMKKNEEFTVEVDEVYKEKEDIKGGRRKLIFYEGAVTCNICEENCHYPGCTKVQSPKDCEVMKKGRCTVCTKKCPASDHVKEEWRYVTKTRKVKKIPEDVKEEYEESKVENEKKKSLMENLETEMKELKTEKTKLLDEVYQHVVILEKIALNDNSLSTHVHLDFLIEKMKERGDTEKVKKLEEMKSRQDEGTRAGLQYMIDTNTPVSSSACGASLSDSSMAQCNASSKYQDIISNSTLISKPLTSPAVYQLRPKEEKFGTLTRKTVGEKNLNKTNRTILLVGETGTGKSALINALVNYTMGVKFKDDIWFEIVEDEKRSQSESQTPDVITYEIFGYEDETLPYSLTIIDTPGYGDTRGNERDDIVSQRLLDLFHSDDGVHELSAVGLVLKASENRVSDRLKYIFDSVMSLFGKDIEKNIIALITHSDGGTPENVLKALEAANIKCAKDEENETVHFLFDNCQNEQRNEMKCFTDFLKESKPQKLNETVEVLNTRIRLTACIQNLKERIQLIELKQREIQLTEKDLKKYQEEMKKNEEFTVEVEEVNKEKEDIKGGMWGLFYEGAVTCNKCKENCHYPCTKVWKPENCEVMKKGRCTVCTKKCPASDHVKEEWRYVTKTRKVKKIPEDVKEEYEESKVENEKKKSLMENVDTVMEELTAEKIKLLDEVYQHVVNLEQIAMNDNSLSTHVHLDFLIEKMKERGDTEKVKKLEEMKSRQDEGTRAGLQYMIGKNKLK
ncbi:uncharacterized protein LOC128379967 [Scomber japonicus]|uniref:uncharacterized protein LOC128379967 n=1 Tax=Scomber japonicus TaxID=13676 RepID=UPI002306904E|nr:uncharacterized protein LOC128379967 [Scomber japonicus]